MNNYKQVTEKLLLSTSTTSLAFTPQQLQPGAKHIIKNYLDLRQSEIMTD
jgi:hypothetical protein